MRKYNEHISNKHTPTIMINTHKQTINTRHEYDYKKENKRTNNQMQVPLRHVHK